MKRKYYSDWIKTLTTEACGFERCKLKNFTLEEGMGTDPGHAITQKVRSLSDDQIDLVWLSHLLHLYAKVNLCV